MVSKVAEKNESSYFSFAQGADQVIVNEKQYSFSGMMYVEGRLEDKVQDVVQKMTALATPLSRISV